MYGNVETLLFRRRCSCAYFKQVYRREERRNGPSPWVVGGGGTLTLCGQYGVLFMFWLVGWLIVGWVVRYSVGPLVHWFVGALVRSLMMLYYCDDLAS